MQTLLIVDDPSDWPLKVEPIPLVAARDYLTNPAYSTPRSFKVYNLCSSYRYQSLGYYVSLLAAARGHKPLPSVSTIQDMKSVSLVRFISSELDELVQKSLAPLAGDRFVLSIYFGKNLAKKYDRLSLHLFNLFQAPFLRAQFVKNDHWQLWQIGPIEVRDIPEDHLDFVLQVAREHLTGRRQPMPKRTQYRYDLAILANTDEKHPPSDNKALQKFMRAAEQMGMRPEIIDKNEYATLAQFDALFIRETTAVNHHTYRFARRAAAEGLVVIDDPESILKCTNKVYLAELLDRHKIPMPKTTIVHKGNVGDIEPTLGLPCILKQPDSSFSLGVVKVSDHASLKGEADRFLERSELCVAQEFVPTPFDWRVGVLNREAIYVCKYYMARKHWQIIATDEAGQSRYGKVETLPVELAPKHVVRAAVKAAALIGDGLYGVDLKETSDKECCVIEVNDNPSIDAGCEDAVIKDKLYSLVMQVFLERIERKKEGRLPQ